jgi:DNA-binding response OmpR family regulator
MLLTTFIAVRAFRPDLAVLDIGLAVLDGHPWRLVALAASSTG